jgi:predicted RNase H-like nuclease
VADPRLELVTLRVADLERASAFYRRAFGVELRAGVEFEVADLAAAHAQAVSAGAEVVQEPREEPRGRASAYRDLDGNLVTLTERPRPLRVAGVDMAQGAWAVVVLEGSQVVDVFRCETFADALLVDVQVIAVDIPIGIPDSEPRQADVAARRFVGPRGSSVFPTPVRRVLEAETYAEAREVAVRLTGKSVSAQTYALRRRIFEVDEHAARDERLIEVHPEVSFRELARRPLQTKHTSFGLAERRALLEEAGIELPGSAPRVNEADLLDATIAAWSAARYARGEAVPLPEAHAERIGAIWR